LFLSRLSRTRGIHAADADIIALAKEGTGLAVIDDEVARKTAKIYSIDYVGTPYILARAASERLVFKTQAKGAVKSMVSSGWRCNV
jgi:predicted nucleic acid-binding protein